MQRVKLDNQTTSPHFIGSWDIQPLAICDELVNFFERQQGKQRKGATAAGINLEAKNSTDISISPKELSEPAYEVFQRYFETLFECHKDYIKQWPFLSHFARKLEIGQFNLQRYFKDEHFQKTHAERSDLGTLHRVLAWMTYLNVVETGGSTTFTHYGLEIQPQKGLTLIWPAEWTHAHRGNPVISGSKYIITGWLHFPE